MIEISRRALLGGVAATALVGVPRPVPVGYLARVIAEWGGRETVLGPWDIAHLRRFEIMRYAFDIRGLEIGTDG